MEHEELEYVGFWVRLVAAIIDTVILLLVSVPLMFVFYGQMTAPVELSLPNILINYVLPIAFGVVFWVTLGATPGKLAMSARVVDADTGEKLTTGKAIIRSLGYFVSAVPLCLGFFWVGLDRRKQGWHDKLANSVVVRPKGQAPVSFTRKP